MWKKTRILFGMRLVRFGLKNSVLFGYCSYLLMYWAVNFQQILQRYCAVLKELCIPWQTRFRSCFKTFFTCTLTASKVIFVTFNLNCGLHALSTENRMHGCQIFGRFRFCSDFFVSESEQFSVFCTPLLRSPLLNLGYWTPLLYATR